MSDSQAFSQSISDELLDQKENEKEKISQDKKACLDKNTKIILILSVCVVLIIIAIVLYVLLHDKENEENNSIKEQKFSVTIDIFKIRKGKGEKEH